MRKSISMFKNDCNVGHTFQAQVFAYVKLVELQNKIAFSLLQILKEFN